MAEVVPVVRNILNCVAELLVVRRVLEWFISWGIREAYFLPLLSVYQTPP